MKTEIAPVVFDFLDLSLYLQSYYKYRKLDKSFSYESWSEELGFNKSRSFLRMILIGKKRASPAFIEAFSKRAFYSEAEKEYFIFLVKYSQAKTHEDKQIYGQKLVRVLRSNLSLQTIEDNAEDFISSPFLPRLFTVVTFRDIKGTAGLYAKLLDASIEQVQNGLEVLKKVQLVSSKVEDGEVIWFALTDRFKVPDEKGSINLLNFHEKSLMDAIAAFDKPKELRSYKSLLLAMNDEELRDFYKSLNEFVAEQMAKYTSNSFDGRRVFQVNFNNYPVTTS
ncbi:MAG: TIGR02147 family protein [Bacillota bacterium]